MKRAGLGFLALALAAAMGCEPSVDLFSEYPYEAARYFRPSRKSAVDTIVIHTTEGRYDESASFEENQKRIYRATLRYFRSPDREVSAHFVVGPGGEVTQMVPTSYTAYHATYYNDRSVGIECAGWADRRETWTPALIESLAELVAKICGKYGVKVERAQGDALAHGGHFEGIGLVGHFQVQTPGSAAVVAEGRAAKTDPGPHFEWSRFVDRVRELTRSRQP